MVGILDMDKAPDAQLVVTVDFHICKLCEEEKKNTKKKKKNDTWPPLPSIILWELNSPTTVEMDVNARTDELPWRTLVVPETFHTKREARLERGEHVGSFHRVLLPPSTQQQLHGLGWVNVQRCGGWPWKWCPFFFPPKCSALTLDYCLFYHKESYHWLNPDLQWQS